jgi:hypothetical protein
MMPFTFVQLHYEPARSSPERLCTPRPLGRQILMRFQRVRTKPGIYAACITEAISVPNLWCPKVQSRRHGRDRTNSRAPGSHSPPDQRSPPTHICPISKTKSTTLHKRRETSKNASAGNRTRGWPISRKIYFTWQRPILPLNHQCN